MGRTAKISDFIDYLVVYLLLLFKAGFMFYEQYSAISSTLLLLILILVINVRKKKVFKTQFNVFLVICLCQLLTYVFCGFPPITKAGAIFVNMITALLVVTLLSYDTFSKCYSDLIFAICLVSLAGHILFMSGLPIIQQLPLLINSKGRSVYFAILAEFWSEPNNGTYRLQGIFWEPGAFQTMIVFAALLDMYKNKPDRSALRFIVYAITIILTYSTTGYVCVLVFILLAIIRGRKIHISQVLFLGAFVAILCFAIVKLMDMLDGFLYYSTFGKLEMLSNAFQSGESNDASSRAESVIVPFKFFLKSPIFGIGENGLNSMTKLLGHNMFTCTPLNFIANYGLLCGFICYYGFANILRLKKKSVFEALILIVLLLLTTSSENFSYNPIFVCFILYGYALIRHAPISDSRISQKQQELVVRYDNI